MLNKINIKKIIFIVLRLFLLFVVIVGLVCADIYIYASSPNSNSQLRKNFIVSSGQSFQTILGGLDKIGVIESPVKFKMLACFLGYEKKIQAGEYALSSSMSPIEILKIMVNGKIRLHKLTVPEGYNMHQIASLVEKIGICSKTDFLQVASNAEFASEKEIDAKTFEGYLFPDTYYFPKQTAPKQIILSMVKQFWAVFDSKYQEETKKCGLSIHQVVTLASIIEKEAGNHEELALVSSVFHNRLKKKMRLESDPTVIYGIKNFDGNITKKHLATLMPYNTYKIRGLPPGPIANAGSKAINAALYPADTHFLYFVSKKDKTHSFSTNIENHNKAVRKYQLKK